jgi:hypothetical protein
MANSSPDLYKAADRLTIFVSSRIGECKEERRVVREAISEINHKAVLFEHIGARPLSPRRLYQSRLRNSHIMVAVYRKGYGYVDTASGMVISGLEDEYRLATEYRIPILLYVHSDDSHRDERLVALIEEASSKVVYHLYRTPEELVLELGRTSPQSLPKASFRLKHIRAFCQNHLPNF